jgi:hypothetical protein
VAIIAQMRTPFTNISAVGSIARASSNTTRTFEWEVVVESDDAAVRAQRLALGPAAVASGEKRDDPRGAKN